MRAALIQGLALVAVIMAMAPLWVFVNVVTVPVLHSRSLLTLFVSAGAALLAAPLINRAGIVNVLGHEVGHLLPAVLTGGRVTEFIASESGGGHILHSSGWRAPVTLGPYVLPLAALTLSLASLLQGAPPAPVWVALIGFATGYHVVRVVADVQNALSHGVVGTDLEVLGAFASLCWIVALNIMILTSLVFFCVGGLTDMWTFWEASWDRVLHFTAYIAGLLLE